jgi:Zn-dependent protease
VNFGKLRHPKRDMIWVALAGPMANLIQAVLWASCFLILGAAEASERFWFEMCRAGVLVNVVMFVFNLFPLPPMDGGRILVGLLPWRQAALVARIEPYGFFIVLALLVAGVISSLWMRPLMALTEQFIHLVLTPLRLLL